MSNYSDLFMRDFKADVGVIPTTASNIWCSPDIIPRNVDFVSDYKTFFKNNYDGPYDYYRNIEQGEYNYIYVRAKNLWNGPRTGKVFLYYMPSSINMYPDQWMNNRIPNANGTDFANFVSTSHGEIVVCDSPFYWSPAPLQPGQGHYCLVAQVVTDDCSCIPTGGEDPFQFGAWIREHGCAAYRNVSVVNQRPDPGYTEAVGIENVYDDAKDFVIVTQTENIPDGTTISLQCPVDGPKPPIDKTYTVKTDEHNFSDIFELPAHFMAKLIVTATAPSGSSFPLGSNIVIYNTEFVPEGNYAEKYAFTLSEMGIKAPATTAKLIITGSYTFEFNQER